MLMVRRRIALGGLGVLVTAAMIAGTHAEIVAQSPAPARAESGDAAVAALVAEVRALRADLAATARNQLRAQMLLGRVQMQEQRLAYLDKQRSDTAAQAAQIALQSQLMRPMFEGLDRGGCNGNGVPAEQRRDCEANAARLKQQFTDMEQREQQLRTQENDLTNALSAEQARWSQFNSQLDELERGLR
jgi:hypothetical protein